MNRRVARDFLMLIALVLGVGAALQVWRGASADRLGEQVAAAAGPGDVHMLAATDCPYCAQARDWFVQQHVAFTECLIDRDPACAARFNATLAPGTPVLLVRGRTIVGFSPQAVADALAAPRPQ